ncbi:MAG: M4 family metallopeptidase [Candidatus Hydrogenedens sp.]|nr:M4 family metallopeptidase [Candidatus Hydrogenedens sp.]
MSQLLKLCLLTIIFVILSFSAFTQGQNEADPQAIAQLLSSYRSQGAPSLPVVYKNSAGYVRFLSAPEGGYFAMPGTGQKSLDIVKSLKDYLNANANAFTNADSKIGFEATTERENGDFFILRFEQTYGSLPVFGSGVAIRTTKDGKILALSCEVARDLSLLNTINLSEDFPIDTETAQQLAITQIINTNKGLKPADIKVLDTPYTTVYEPALLKMPGAPTVVYVISLGKENTNKQYRVLVDAFTGEIRLNYRLCDSVIDREIYDANGSYNIPNTVARKEGDNPTGIADVDDTFDYLGDAYNFFAVNHKRDSYDDKGAALRAVVRIPILNAFWDPTTKFFWFGTGFAVDDVVAHEYTHPVIEKESGLIYFGEPGAITESLCDVWGEYVDLTNEKGTDTDNVRWLVGEDLPAGVPWENSSGTAVRNMKDPTASNQPDRYTSPLFIKSTTSIEDNGGVHTNSGVGNKLTYLLTDGDTFNGEQVKGFGIIRTAKLYYGALELLPPVADYSMFALALNASAVAQGLSLEDRYNLSRAMKAVEILPSEAFELGARDFRATSITLDDDSPAIMLTWTPPNTLDYRQVILVKKAGSYPTSALDGSQLFSGKGDRFLDVNVSAGIEYFYALFVDMENLPPMELYDSAVAGEVSPSTLTQEFLPDFDPRKPVTEPIFYSQICFIPTGAPVNPLDGNKYFGGYSNYDATFTPEVFSFPVKREDATGSSYTIPLSTDGLVSFNLDVPFPFFGKKYGIIYLGANGYIAFEPIPLESTKNLPSLASHFAIPRISFLFSDLAPDTAGEIWTRQLEDRFVITFENIPKNVMEGIPNPLSGANPGSSVQVELFFSGHIRITYLQLDTNYCVVGLSDGRGVPPDPYQVFPDDIPYSINRYTDFPALPSQPTKLNFQPSPIYKVFPNQTISFDVVSQYYGETVPILWAEWLLDGVPPFANVGKGKGKFSWTPSQEIEGMYYVRVIARQDMDYTYQDIPIIVKPVIIPPQAINLRISSQSPAEDTTASRVVSAGRPLVASYDYVHPLMVKYPTQYMEGPSILYWFRNHETVPALTNYRTVPPNVTKGGDIWYFRVIPITISGIVGEEAMSPIIYVAGQPQISSVYPNKGKTTGGEIVRIRGEKFTGLLEVKFGGVPVPSFKLVNESEIEVTTPQHLPGLVDIYVQTVGGFSTLSQAFEYYEETQQAPKEETPKKKFIISCGNNSSKGSSYIADGFFFSLVFLMLSIRNIKNQRETSNK